MVTTITTMAIAMTTPPSEAVGLDYLRDPAAIYRASFAAIRQEVELSALPPALHPIALRLVHACGMPEIIRHLAWSEAFAERAGAALASGSTILVDTRMVEAGILARQLAPGTRLRCTLDDPRTPELAEQLRTTRSAAAVELWQPDLERAVVVIGNAPTALFHLLERLADWSERPAAIIAMPVGFIGAAESKAALAAHHQGIPFLTLHGRLGGSALAAAAVNALIAEPA